LKILALVSLSLAFSACAQDQRPRNPFETDILVETFGYGPGTPARVEASALYQGCPRKDCIPSIDAPAYLAGGNVDFLAEDDLILGLDINGQQWAFPIRILDYHEIVNDRLGGQPVIVTWCPLCGSGLAFDPRIGDEVLEFGVSGLLHDSDLVMYDRKTGSLWQQITGEAIMGEHLSRTLTQIPSTITDWAAWLKAHPDTLVLSPETGFERDYFGRAAYAGYETSDRLMFPASQRDFSVHPKTVVFGFDLGGTAVAVQESSLDKRSTMTYQDGRTDWLIERHADGRVTARNDSGQTHTAIRLFWFAWYNFNPDTQRL